MSAFVIDKAAMKRAVRAICAEGPHGKIVPLFDGKPTADKDAPTVIGRRLYALNIIACECCDFVDTILDALEITVPEASWESPSDQADFALAVIERRDAALKALLEWGREHTSPRDPNSPHALLIEAAASLEPFHPPEEPDDEEEAAADAAG